MNTLKVVVNILSPCVATLQHAGWTFANSKASEVNIELNRLQVAWHE